MRARGRKGFGWTRWSSEWLYGRLSLFKQLPARSMVRCGSRSSTIGHITVGNKQTGAPSAGNPHAGGDAAGAGNGFTVWLRTSRGNGEQQLGGTFGIPRQSSTRPPKRKRECKPTDSKCSSVGEFGNANSFWYDNWISIPAQLTFAD